MYRGIVTGQQCSNRSKGMSGDFARGQSPEGFPNPQPHFSFASSFPRPYFLGFKLSNLLLSLSPRRGVTTCHCCQAVTVASRGPPQGTAICTLHVQDVFPVMFPVKKKQPPDKSSRSEKHHPSCRLICSNLGNTSLTFACATLIQPPYAHALPSSL